MAVSAPTTLHALQGVAASRAGACRGAGVPGAAQAVTGELDVAAILARRDEIISDLDDSGQLSWLHSRGVTLITGHGRRLDGGRRVRVGDDVLQASRVAVVATGSAAAIPPAPGLAALAPWTNRQITTAASVPDG